MQFLSEIILVISNRSRAERSFDLSDLLVISYSWIICLTLLRGVGIGFTALEEGTCFASSTISTSPDLISCLVVFDLAVDSFNSFLAATNF